MTPLPFRRIAMMALFISAALASASSPAVELRGFRGVPWGADVSSLGPAPRLALSNGDVSCYRREHENMLYGEVPLTDVRYCFHRGHLYLVAVDADAPLDTLRSEFQSTYGPPDQREPSKWVWGSSSTASRVELQAPAQGAASMLMYSSEYEPRPARQAKAF